MEQYRAEFLEKESQASDSGGEMEHVMRKPGVKKRRVMWRLRPEESFPLKQELAAASDREETARSSDSGGSRVSSPELTTTVATMMVQRPLFPKGSKQKRVRPSPTWFDAFHSRHERTMMEKDALSPRLLPPVRKLPCPDALCGMKLEKTAPAVKRCTAEEEEEDDANQRRAANMWLKKALNKRHREECGMS